MGGLAPQARPELSLVIPAYNEAARLPRTLALARAHLERAVPDHEIVVVDSGSADDTSKVAAEALAGHPRARVVRLAVNAGKGGAVRAGMLAASGRVVLFSDADFSTPIEEETRLRQAIRGGADVAIASRTHPDAHVERGSWMRAHVTPRVFNLLVRLLGLTSCTDTQCGFKMFTREAVLAIFPRCRVDGFAFDVEALVLAERAGLRVAELPVVWIDDPRSSVRVVRDSLRMIVELVRIRIRIPPRFLGGA